MISGFQMTENCLLLSSAASPIIARQNETKLQAPLENGKRATTLNLRTALGIRGASPRRIVPVVVREATKTNKRAVQGRQFVSRNSGDERLRDLCAVCRTDTKSGRAIPKVSGRRAEARLVGVAVSVPETQTDRGVEVAGAKEDVI